jgi:hypothetical protein
MESLQRRFIINFSFWGFEEPQHLPPNIYMMGPTMDGKKDNTKLRKVDPTVCDWCDEAHANGEYILYVGFGSEVYQQPWYVEYIYKGCLEAMKSVKFRVIWSLRNTKEKISPPEGYDKNKFLFSDWLP